MYGFRDYFTLLFGVLFTFPSRYLFAIGLSGVFSLARWCWQIPTRFLRSRGTQELTRLHLYLITGLSPSMVSFSNEVQLYICNTTSWSYNPGNALTIPVWALSCSLATTYEISIDLFSSAYLDVSVQQVGTYCNRYTVGFPHSEIYGSKVI